MKESKERLLFVKFNIQDLIEPGAILGNEIANKYNMNNNKSTTSIRKQYESYQLYDYSFNDHDAKFEDLFDTLAAPSLVISRSSNYIALVESRSGGGIGPVGLPPSFTSLPVSVVQTRRNSFADLEAVGKSLSTIGLHEGEEEDSTSTKKKNQPLPKLITPPATPTRNSFENEEFLFFENENNDFPLEYAKEESVTGGNMNKNGNDELFDMKAFLSPNEYENAINALHTTVKDHLLKYLYSIELKQLKEELRKEGKEGEKLTPPPPPSSSDGKSIATITGQDGHTSQKQLTKDDKNDRNQSIFLPIITTLIGYVLFYNEDYPSAIDYYSRYNLIHQSRISQCLLKVFLKEYSNPFFQEKFDERSFIVNHYSIKPTVGIHAYRLILELIHNEVRHQIEQKQKLPLVLDSSIDFSSFRLFLRSGGQSRRKKLIKSSSK